MQITERFLRPSSLSLDELRDTWRAARSVSQALATGAVKLLKCFLSKLSCVVSGKYILYEKKSGYMLEEYGGYSGLNEMQSHLFFSKGWQGWVREHHLEVTPFQIVFLKLGGSV